MAYTFPKDLDGFLPHLSKIDTRHRLQVGSDLLVFLTDPSNSLVCQDIGQLVDGIVPWMQSSNYKVSANGIDVMTQLIDRLGPDFRPYLQVVLPIVIDRLGDTKDTVRERAQLVILKLMERSTLPPQVLFEKLCSGFSHKNAKIREELLRCLVTTINEYGAQSLTLNKFTPDIVKLLSDPTSSVRDAAFNTIVELYRHVGDKLRVDLQRRNLIPASKWPTLAARFDDVKNNDDLLPTATKMTAPDFNDEVDRVMIKPAVPFKKPNLVGSAVKARGIVNVNPATSVGAVDEDIFMKSFEDVPTIQIFSPRDVTEHLNSIGEIISDSNKDWTRRMDALKKIRSLIIAGATAHEEFHTGIKQLEFHLQAIIKDLRSQVVREGCITIAYLAQTLTARFERTAERLLPPLINLIQNSAKIMATSALVTVRLIIRHIYSGRFLPLICSSATTSKSKEIRKSCCEFLDFVLNNWPRNALERHLTTLQDAIKKGITDADPEARILSRKAFRGFREHFPDQAEMLLQSLDASYRRTLQGDGMSASSSNSNLSTGGYRPVRLYANSSNNRVIPASHSATDSGGMKRDLRSNSAIDLQAARRAKARNQYAALARSKINCGTATIPRNRKLAVDNVMPLPMQSPERLARHRNRNSQSQPTSRSGSPSSRLAYLYHRNHGDYETPPHITGGTGGGFGGGGSGCSGGRRLRSNLPRSTTTSRNGSRETSPNRLTVTTLGRLRRGLDRPPLSPASRPLLAQKILQQSREAESALADAFTADGGIGGGVAITPMEAFRSPRRGHKSLDSDESETSSVCSERSMDSLRRTSDDIREIISLCASTNWQERKDGLLSLQHYISGGETLTAEELNQLTRLLTRMFLDSHTKALCVFLDTVIELLRTYSEALHDWLYIVLQRVVTKLGADTGLHSVHTKLTLTLDVIRQHFPAGLVIGAVYAYLLDVTQTPSTKVKVTVMTFLAQVCTDAAAASTSGGGTQGQGGQQMGGGAQTRQALQKILSYAHDMKSSELRTASKACIIAMWNSNTSQMARLLGELPKEQQDIAAAIIHHHMRRNSSGGGTANSSLTTVESSNSLGATSTANLLNTALYFSPSNSSRLLSPLTPPTNTPPPTHPTNNTYNNSGSIDHEEIFRTLRKTTAEIQNYSFEGVDSGVGGLAVAPRNGGSGTAVNVSTLEILMETMSLDSSSTSVNNNNNNNNSSTPVLMNRFHHPHYYQRHSNNNNTDNSFEMSSSGPKSLPVHYAPPINGVAAMDSGGGDLESNGYRSLGDLRNSDVVKAVLEQCHVSHPTSAQFKQQILFQLIDMIKNGHVDSIIVNFKKLLRIIIDHLQGNDMTTQIAGLDVLTAIFQREDMKKCWEDFVELITLTILRALSDENREVVKVAEITSAAMHVFFPFDQVALTLSTLIQTNEYPSVLGPIKMLTKLIEAKPTEVTDAHLEEIMPGLIKCTDHLESVVRKNAIFCMVAVCRSVGEDRLAPYLNRMTGCKVKLLKLYVGRSNEQVSLPSSSSPRNSNGNNGNSSNGNISSNAS